jgi:hypothetical protein
MREGCRLPPVRTVNKRQLASGDRKCVRLENTFIWTQTVREEKRVLCVRYASDFLLFQFNDRLKSEEVIVR